MNLENLFSFSSDLPIPAWEEDDGPRCMDTEMCLALLEGKRIEEVDTAKLLGCSFCFSYLSSRFLLFYLPAFCAAIYRFPGNEHADMVIERVLDLIHPGGYFLNNCLRPLPKTRRAIIANWIAWLKEASPHWEPECTRAIDALENLP